MHLLHMYEHTDVIQCPSLTIDNGVVTIDASDGSNTSQATYTCDDGYSLKGDGTRICQEDDTWTGADPTCCEFSREQRSL